MPDPVVGVVYWILAERRRDDGPGGFVDRWHCHGCGYSPGEEPGLPQDQCPNCREPLFDDGPAGGAKPYIVNPDYTVRPYPEAGRPFREPGESLRHRVRPPKVVDAKGSAFSRELANSVRTWALYRADVFGSSVFATGHSATLHEFERQAFRPGLFSSDAVLWPTRDREAILDGIRVRPNNALTRGNVWVGVRSFATVTDDAGADHFAVLRFTNLWSVGDPLPKLPIFPDKPVEKMSIYEQERATCPMCRGVAALHPLRLYHTARELKPDGSFPAVDPNATAEWAWFCLDGSRGKTDCRWQSAPVDSSGRKKVTP